MSWVSTNCMLCLEDGGDCKCTKADWDRWWREVKPRLDRKAEEERRLGPRANPTSTAALEEIVDGWGMGR